MRTYIVERKAVPEGPNEFPSRLITLRENLGLSQRRLSILCEGEPSERTIRAWENSEVVPRLSAGFVRCAEVLNVTPGFLRWGREE